jgi:hypothetical protein
VIPRLATKLEMRGNTLPRKHSFGKEMNRMAAAGGTLEGAVKKFPSIDALVKEQSKKWRMDP